MSHHLYIPLASLSPDTRKRWLASQLKKIEKMADDQKRALEIKVDNESKLKDTKPLLYVHKDADWPIVVVGAGQSWYNDLVDLAKKRGEQDRFKTHQPTKRPHPLVTLDTLLDKYNRSVRKTRTFHIKNNPISLRG